MKHLLNEIRACQRCAGELPLGCRPVVQAGEKAKVAIVGQAPGTKVHASGVPWDDASGRQLREWLGVNDELFYNPEKIALIPMGFCYPGKGKSGDLPPKKVCAPTWHLRLWEALGQVELVLLVGQYAQHYYLPNTSKQSLTYRVQHYKDFGPRFIPLPHPSPRNRFWLKNNPWFHELVLPELRKRMQAIFPDT